MALAVAPGCESNLASSVSSVCQPSAKLGIPGKIAFFIKSEMWLASAAQSTIFVFHLYILNQGSWWNTLQKPSPSGERLCNDLFEREIFFSAVGSDLSLSVVRNVPWVPSALIYQPLPQLCFVSPPSALAWRGVPPAWKSSARDESSSAGGRGTCCLCQSVNFRPQGPNVAGISVLLGLPKTPWGNPVSLLLVDFSHLGQLRQQQGSFPSFLPHSFVCWPGTHTGARTDLAVWAQCALFLLFSSEEVWTKNAYPLCAACSSSTEAETNLHALNIGIEALHVKRIYKKTPITTTTQKKKQESQM